jgi:hypothetical protein
MIMMAWQFKSETEWKTAHRINTHYLKVPKLLPPIEKSEIKKIQWL